MRVGNLNITKKNTLKKFAYKRNNTFDFFYNL